MSIVLVKVYGALYPLEQNPLPLLRHVVPLAMGADEEWLFFEGDMLRISFEGIYFPEDDLLAVLLPLLPATVEGKIDILDLEGWKLTRYIWKAGEMQKTSRELNSVLDYSGH